jgi:2-amino-4-hydroxy-6-hydroxymethyldihydropteridine diphosphokinase
MDNKGVTAFIGVGSNINSEHNIASALVLLEKHVSIIGISSFYRTKPLSGENQDDYLNGVWEISTSLRPHKLKFSLLREIEKKLNRNRQSDKYASRTIDLDLLLFGNLVISEELLIIPDSDIYKRSFIAFPLFELNPDLIIPDKQIPITTVLSTLSNDHMVPDNPFTESLRKMTNV